MHAECGPEKEIPPGRFATSGIDDPSPHVMPLAFFMLLHRPDTLVSRTDRSLEAAMHLSDPFSTHYSELLDGTYDCVDRIILNGYFSLGCNPGGFRTWWRRLYGSDDNLDNSALQRMSGRFSRRLHAYAKKHKIPVVYSKDRANERKHIIAEGYRPQDPEFVGLFLVIIGRAPGLVWKVDRSPAGLIRNIGRRKTQSWVNHLSFHIMDSDWGHVTFKICGQPPFAAQIMLNGHEYVARQAQKRRVTFIKDGNCFVSTSSGAGLAKIAETLRSSNAVGQLTQLCDRWIYSSCLFFALPPEEQKRSGFRYNYSVYQIEYSRNLLFHRGSELERVMQAMIDQTRSSLDVRKIRTLFGYKHRPKFKRGGKRNSRIEVGLERPVYDLTVFKVHFGYLTLKAYTKGERVLRFEAVVHNIKALHCRRSLPKFPDIVSRLRGMIERFLEVLACVGMPSIRSDTWDQLREPSRVGATRVPGIDISKKRNRVFIEAVIALASMPGGFSVKDLSHKVRERSPSIDYSPSKAAYDLRKLRGKAFVEKVPKSRSYFCSPSGLQTMAALLVITDKVIRPVLAGALKKRRGRPSKTQSPVDIHYRRLQSEMRKLFDTLGIAA